MRPHVLALSKDEEADVRRFMRETRRKDEYRRGEAVLYKAGGYPTEP